MPNLELKKLAMDSDQKKKKKIGLFFNQSNKKREAQQDLKKK